MGHSVLDKKPRPEKLTNKESFKVKVLGREVYGTEGKKTVSPMPAKQTTEESGEGGVQVVPAKASVAVAAKKTTKKSLEFRQSDSNSTPPTSTNTGNTSQSQTSSSTQKAATLSTTLRIQSSIKTTNRPFLTIIQLGRVLLVLLIRETTSDFI